MSGWSHQNTRLLLTVQTSRAFPCSSGRRLASSSAAETPPVIGAARCREENAVMPASESVSGIGVRVAACGPATERKLRGQSSRFGIRIDLAPEVTCVGGGPG